MSTKKIILIGLALTTLMALGTFGALNLAILSDTPELSGSKIISAVIVGLTLTGLVGYAIVALTGYSREYDL